MVLPRQYARAQGLYYLECGLLLLQIAVCPTEFAALAGHEAEALLQLVQQARADTLLPGRIDDRLKPDMDDADAAGDQDKGYQHYNGYQN